MKELVFGEKLGVGTSADVYKGSYREQEVAIKVMRPLLDPKLIENFKKELDIMGYVSHLNQIQVMDQLTFRYCQAIEVPEGCVFFWNLSGTVQDMYCYGILFTGEVCSLFRFFGY